ncbi:hypothetical protein ACU8OG_37430 (plasmid) [Rhizobium leguminosarum]
MFSLPERVRPIEDAQPDVSGDPPIVVAFGELKLIYLSAASKRNRALKQIDGAAMNRKEMSTPTEFGALMLVGCRKEGSLTCVLAARHLGVLPVIRAADSTLCDYLTARSLETIQVNTSNLHALRHVYLWLLTTGDIVGILCFSGETTLSSAAILLCGRRIAALIIKTPLEPLKLSSLSKHSSLHTPK